MKERRQYYPLFLDIAGMPCVVVGGGKVAERKVRMLLAFGARVRVISPRVTNGILRLRRDNRIEVLLQPYASGDLAGAVLAFAATSDRKTNETIHDDAASMGIPVNVADTPDLCDFIVPSIVRKGALVVAVSTSGTAPGVAKRMKGDVDRFLSKEYVDYVALVARFRKLLIEAVPLERERKAILGAVLDMEIGTVLSSGLRGLKRRFLGKA